MFLRSAVCAIGAAVAGASILGTLFYVGSTLTGPQGAVLNEYLKVYCNPPPDGADIGQKMFHAGEAALISRLTIKTGIGPVALARYYECKVR